MEKIQMTEEQAIEIIQCVYDTKSRDFNYALERLKEKGYIRKSELETLVEEAEKMYRIYSEEPATEFNKKYSCDVEVSEFLIKVIREMKKGHPEFKK